MNERHLDSDDQAFDDAAIDSLLAELAPRELEPADWDAIVDTLASVSMNRSGASLLGVNTLGERADAHLRDDARAVSSRLAALVEKQQASPRLLASWRRLLFAERYDVPAGSQAAATHLRWKRTPPERLSQILQGVDVEIAPSLGDEIVGTTLSGPRRTRLVLGRDAFLDALEAEFVLYRLYLHTLADLPVEGYGCWVEFKHDSAARVPRDLVGEPAARDREDWIDDTAAALMYDFYATAPTSPRPGWSILRSALKRHALETPFLRALLDDSHGVRADVRDRLLAIYATTAAMPFASVTRPRSRFTEHIAIVREHPWSRVYLIWADQRGRWRRWIPSRKVLAALGLRPADVAVIDDIRAYRYDGVLLDPDDVRHVAALLQDAIDFSLLPRLGIPTARLAGLAKPFAPRSLDTLHREGRLLLVESPHPEPALAPV